MDIVVYLYKMYICARVCVRVCVFVCFLLCQSFCHLNLQTPLHYEHLLIFDVYCFIFSALLLLLQEGCLGRCPSFMPSKQPSKHGQPTNHLTNISLTIFSCSTTIFNSCNHLSFQSILPLHYILTCISQFTIIYLLYYLVDSNMNIQHL